MIKTEETWVNYFIFKLVNSYLIKNITITTIIHLKYIYNCHNIILGVPIKYIYIIITHILTQLHLYFVSN